MDQAEFDALMAARERSLKVVEPETQFSSGLICELHRNWLKGIYVWAGRYRTVGVAKGGFRWPPAQLVAQHMETFSQGILARNTPCLPGSMAVVARRLAEVHAELLLIHPFREGNGRVARWVADLMALQAGYPLPEYGLSSRSRQSQSPRGMQYLEAVRRGYLQDYDFLTRFFEDSLRRGLMTP